MTAAVQEAGAVDLSKLATKSDLREEVLRIESKIDRIKPELEAKIELTKSDILRWMFGAMAAQTALIVGLAKLLR